MPLDMQKRMKAQAELAYTRERLVQIRANMESQGFNKVEYENLEKKKKELVDQLSG